MPGFLAAIYHSGAIITTSVILMNSSFRSIASKALRQAYIREVSR